MTSDERRARGLAAQRILDDELFKEAVAALRAEIQREWEQSPVRDPDARERLYLMIRLLDKLVGHLSVVMQDGAMAVHDQIERRRRFGVL